MSYIHTINLPAGQPESVIAPRELFHRLGPGTVLLDVRTPGEHAAAHVAGAQLVPLDDLDAAAFLRRHGGAGPVYVLCQSGSRARLALAKLRRAGFDGGVLVEGGLQAWLDAGLPVSRGGGRVLPLMRQVQVVVGLLAAAGSALALGLDARFAVIPLLLGGGLLFAGISGHCGLALLLAKMPWNRAARSAPGRAH